MKVAVMWQWFFLLYFLVLNSGYLLLNVVSFLGISRYIQENTGVLTRVYSGFEIPISILVPAFNEQATIESSVRSLLQLNYPEFEVLVINDGSEDGTMEVLKHKFLLRAFPEAYRDRLPVKKVRAIYASAEYPNLRVVDKENGGKADALNAGINTARYPLFCSVDADSILQRDSLQRVVVPFLEDPTTVASGGTVRLANGCRVKHGFLEEIGLPKNALALIQVAEYLRAFLFGRLGWSYLNALLLISGTFSMFHKETAVAVGGYSTNTVGEDMELVVRMHRVLRRQKRRYRITFLPDPICWTEAPEDLHTLKAQRVRWQQGYSESLWMNLGLLFGYRSGLVGWVAFPFAFLFEFLGPVVEGAGYIYFIFGLLFGLVSYRVMLAFLVLSVGFGMLISVNSLLLEEISFHIYSRPRELVVLFLAAVVENFGYRQLTVYWRAVGLIRFILGRKNEWGKMRRRGSWQENA